MEIYLIAIVVMSYFGFVLGLLNQVSASGGRLEPVKKHIWWLPIVVPILLIRYAIVKHRIAYLKLLIKTDELSVGLLYCLADDYYQISTQPIKKAAKVRKLKAAKKREYDNMFRKVDCLLAAT
jgi:hypothetical protein